MTLYITIFRAQCADIGSEFVPHMGKCQIFNCGSTTAGLSPWPLFSLTISLTPLHERFYCLSWLKFELTFAGRNCFQKLLWDTFTDDETFMRATRYDNSSRFLKVIDKLTIWAAHLYGFTMASDGESDDDTQRHKNSKTKKPQSPRTVTTRSWKFLTNFGQHFHDVLLIYRTA